MDQQEIGEVSQAFSTLSDVQELLGVGDTEAANAEINHAKRHLMVVIERAQAETSELFRDAIMSVGLCTLRGTREGFDAAEFPERGNEDDQNKNLGGTQT